MPEADFSEFSYGYAVTREAEALLVACLGHATTAPTLPSLLKENTVGYDAKLVVVEFALLLQFKRAFFVSRQHTSPCIPRGAGPHCTWDYWQQPHYRFKVALDSNQFHAMRGYENEVSLGYLNGTSLYAAPLFHTQAQFDAAFAANSVLDRSVGVAPSQFDVVATTADPIHHFSVLPGPGASVVTSEPFPTEVSSLRDHIVSAQSVSQFQTEDRAVVSLEQLVEWATQQSGTPDRLLRFDRQSAPEGIAFLNSFAASRGAAFVLVGREVDT
jgi:hypothetical protein